MESSRGRCHCGAIEFEVAGRPVRATLCNCSICTMKGYLHWIVPRESFVLRRGADDLTTYRFNTGVAEHRFCRHCGVAPFYVPRSDPDKIDVNVRCLEDVDVAEIPTEPFDGRNWETASKSWQA